MTDYDVYDAVVVGGGAAGLAAATMLGRSRRRVAVVDGGEPRNATAGHLHGFLSRDDMSPVEFLAAGRDEVARYGGRVIKDVALGVTPGAHGFLVRLANRSELAARCVLVTTGLRDELPDVPGVRERWGQDVVHCPYCHGYEVRDTPIGVLGGDVRPYTLLQASLVRQWSADVVFFPNRIVLTEEERELLAARGVRVVDGEVARLVVRENQLYGLELTDGQVIPRATVFVGPRSVPRDELLIGLGCQVKENGWVAVDPMGQTSVPGVWAAGNVVDERALLITAAATGTFTAVAMNHTLIEQETKQVLATTAQRQV